MTQKKNILEAICNEKGSIEVLKVKDLGWITKKEAIKLSIEKSWIWWLSIKIINLFV